MRPSQRDRRPPIGFMVSPALIKEVYREHCLWDPGHPKFSDNVFKQGIWEGIAGRFVDATVESVKKKWKSLKTARTNNLNEKKRKLHSGAAAVRHREYIYAKQMSFLDGITYRDDMEGNMPENNKAADGEAEGDSENDDENNDKESAIDRSMRQEEIQSEVQKTVHEIRGCVLKEMGNVVKTLAHDEPHILSPRQPAAKSPGKENVVPPGPVKKRKVDVTASRRANSSSFEMPKGRSFDENTGERLNDSLQLKTPEMKPSCSTFLSKPKTEKNITRKRRQAQIPPVIYEEDEDRIEEMEVEEEGLSDGETCKSALHPRLLANIKKQGAYEAVRTKQYTQIQAKVAASKAEQKNKVSGSKPAAREGAPNFMLSPELESALIHDLKQDKSDSTDLFCLSLSQRLKMLPAKEKRAVELKVLQLVIDAENAADNVKLKQMPRKEKEISFNFDKGIEDEPKVGDQFDEVWNPVGQRFKLPDSMMPQVQEVFTKPDDDIVVSAFKIDVKGSDIKTLKPNTWLNDEVINVYFNLIMERSSTEDHLPKALAVNSFLVTNLKDRGLGSVSKWFKLTFLFDYDIILIPNHHDGNHWSLIVVFVNEKIIRHYNSVINVDSEALDEVLQWVGEESEKKGSTFDSSEWKLEAAQGIPRQNNINDCGVFTCAYAECLSRRAPIGFTQDDIPNLRLKIAYEITNQVLLFSDD